MAVPTITTVTPSEGPSMGGNMVEIVGTNFRLPDPPPATGPSPPPTQTVLVSFGGVPAKKVFVVSSTRLFTPAPKYPLVDSLGRPLVSALVGVEVANLDNSEVEIPGETVTAAGSYTYGRPDISAENQSDFTRLVRTMLRLMKSEIIPNIVLELDTDYNEDLSIPKPHLATLPGIAVIGPDLVANTFFQDWSDRTDTALGTGEFLIQRRYHTVNLGFDIIGYSNNEVEFLNMMNLVTLWKDRNHTLCMDCVEGDPSAGQICYEFEFAEGGQFRTEKQTGVGLNSNLKVFRGQVVIVGFNFAGLPAVVRDNGIGVGAKTADAVVNLPSVESTGDNLPDDLAQARRGPPPKGLS